MDRAISATTVLTPLGPQPSVMSPQERSISLYEASFALTISVASYDDKKNWRDLPSTTKEIDDLSLALRKHGFQVTRLKDPTGDELEREISRFVGVYGRLENTRIVIVFSGHGYVERSNNTAYFVPRDAGSPTTVGSNFYITALALEDFRSKVMRMHAKHGLFIFDNCYSGMIFRSAPAANYPAERGNTTIDRWRYLDRNAKTPVRQFISAGGPDELLPATSIFARALLEGLAGAASRGHDGYVTGKELGLFVSEQVTNQSRNQLPLSDVLGSNLGDMVFQVAIPRAFSDVPANPVMPAGNLPRATDAVATSALINDLDTLRNELDLSKAAFNAKEASQRFSNIASRLPHWYYPARMAALKGCQAYATDLELLRSLSDKWTGDDYSLVKCEIAAYRTLGQEAALAKASARGAAAYEDTDTFTRKLIVGPTTFHTVNGQWVVIAQRRGDALELSFTDGWVGGKNVEQVKKITVGVYYRPPDGGPWQKKHKRACEVPFDNGSAKGSDIFKPVKAKSFQCSIELIPATRLAGVQVVLTFDLGDSKSHMYSTPYLAPSRVAGDRQAKE
ncbi:MULTISPECIES: caspase family protein [unclassified Achromobacter]|uniref:caspase family protein n=1 Tax=unclassified Achromobacter TaxID=2626865 RepID=UPI0013031CC1|nr:MULTISPECIES: caspase family protein [unclassified Achromobacter]